uniref:Uncharacterized protein n=1 Tax=Peronospora matthiolae TaxID=2874970 RepID=A0AAV1ULR0_9STRA
MVHKSMRCPNKAAESASARLCADAVAETTATDVSSVAKASQPVSPGDADARHEDTHVFTEYELGVSYSPDTKEGSVSKAVETKPPAKCGMDYATRRSIFGSSDESDQPSPKRRRSRSQDLGAHSGVSSPSETTSQRDTSAYVGTSQEERDRNVLRLAPEKKTSLPSVRQPSVGSGAPKYPRTGDSRATGRDNSSDVRSRSGGSTAAQPDSAGHRESPLMEVEEEGRRSPHNRGEACVSESFFDRVTQVLRNDLEHERGRRLQLADAASKHRAEFAFVQLENERALTSLRNELRVARGIVDRSRAEVTALQTLVDGHHREHKALCEVLERKGVLHRKKQRTDSTA